MTKKENLKRLQELQAKAESREQYFMCLNVDKEYYDNIALLAFMEKRTKSSVLNGILTDYFNSHKIVYKITAQNSREYV